MTEINMNPEPEDAVILNGRLGLAAALALALAIVADLLFWDVPVGLSLAVFAVLLMGAVWCVLRPGWSAWPAVLVLLIGVLPVVEYVQALSVAILVIAVLAACVMMTRPGGPLAGVFAGAVRLLAIVPVAAVLAAVGGLRRVRRPGETTLIQLLRGWAFPIGGTLVFAALLMDANPVLARVLSFEVEARIDPGRVLLWIGVFLVVWPFVAGPVPSDRPFAGVSLEGVGPAVGVNAPSTLRALVMFNLLIAVQTVMDVSIFLGGAELPAGMSLASYAHRGAYPLLATALLAGAFALMARPFLDDNKWVRPLMMLWLAQNVALCLSAVLRLDLYVGVYGLTYLRVYAGIWMAVVAVGLMLIGWQVWRGRSNGWLFLRGVILCGGVLYVCAFVNFAQMIARYNVENDVEQDVKYLCLLGETAAVPLQGMPPETVYHRSYSDTVVCDFAAPEIEGWRDWSAREWRVARALAAMEADSSRR